MPTGEVTEAALPEETCILPAGDMSVRRSGAGGVSVRRAADKETGARPNDRACRGKTPAVRPILDVTGASHTIMLAGGFPDNRVTDAIRDDERAITDAVLPLLPDSLECAAAAAATATAAKLVEPASSGGALIMRETKTRT